MTLWLKVRRVPTVLAAAFALFTVLTASLGNVVVVLPSLAGGTQVALSLFVPIPLVAGLALCLESGLTGAEVSAVRSTAFRDAVLVAAAVLTAALIGHLVHHLMYLPPAEIVGRNTAFLTGLMLCTRALSQGAATLAPAAWTITVVVVGFRSTGDAYPWTIIAEPASALHAAVGAVLLFAVGICTQMYTSRKFS